MNIALATDNSNAVAPEKTWEQAVLWLRAQPDQQELVKACYYDDPLPSSALRYWESEEWSSIRHFLPAQGGKALDVGAGRGISSFALAKDGFSTTALEPDGSAIVGAQAIRDLAQASGLAIEVKQEFSEQLPFADGQFNIVFARAVLHHARDLKAACREFFRVLKPGGILIAVREHVISRPEDLPAFLDSHPLHKLYGGESAFLLAQYEDAIKSAGFHLDVVLSPLESPINFSPYTLASLRAELAQRIGRRVPGIGILLRWLLGVPGVWPIARLLLARVDHRPGRLYSFIARHP